MTDVLLECKNLCKTYGHKSALNGISLQLQPGKIIGLLGPNGSGKTTFLKLINGLLTPSAGSLLINGKPPGRESKAIVAYLPERTYLNDSMKVREALRFFADFYSDFDLQRAEEMLRNLNIETTARLKTLSKGTKEKVQLILVMSRRADLYLLDEPIGGVDPAARDFILSTIIGSYREDATVLISTHLIRDVEQVLDDVVFLAYGKVGLCAPAEDLREEKGKSLDELFREMYRC